MLTSREGRRTRTPHLALLVPAALVAALLNPTSGALASPEPSPAPVPPPDIAAVSLAEDRGIDLAEAQTRMDWQVKASNLADDLAGLPEFGGLWIDVNDGDRVKIGLTAPANVRHAVTNAGLDAVDTVPVKYRYTQLVAANAWLSARLARIDAEVMYPLITSLRPDRNAVQLRAPAGRTPTPAQSALVREAAERFGSMLLGGTYEGRPEARACVYPFCDPPLRGGIRIFSAGGGCTGAFLARSRTDNKLYQFTAGHCALDGNTGTWSSNFTNGHPHPIGAIGPRWRFSRNGDMAIIQVANPAGWNARAWVNVTASSYTTANSQYPIRADGGTVVGMRICTTGGYYGKSDCGNVQHVGVPLTYEGVRVENLAEGNFCGVKGDSGAPMFAGNVAYGLQVAGLTTCDSFYQGIHAAKNALNVNVAFSP